MKVLMLSSDQLVFSSNSAVRARMRDYATICDELHIAIFSGRNSYSEIHEGNLHVYPITAPARFLLPWQAIRVGKKIIRAARLQPIDSLITAQDPFEIGWVGWRIARATGIKLQLQVHTDFLSPWFALESFKNRARVALAKFLLRHAESVRVVSKKIAASLAGLVTASTKIIILPIFVADENPLTPENESKKIDLHGQYPEFKFIALMVSRLTKEKNILSAARAIDQARAAGLSLGLVVVGDGPERSALDHFDFVRFVGWIDDPRPYMRGADLFLNTSFYEGYGRTLVEAATVGVPIVTTDVGVAREVVRDGENGFVVPVNDEAALASALQKTIALSKNFAPLVSEFTKEKYLQAYKESWSIM